MEKNRREQFDEGYYYCCNKVSTQCRLFLVFSVFVHVLPAVRTINLYPNVLEEVFFLFFIVQASEFQSIRGLELLVSIDWLI